MRSFLILDIVLIYNAMMSGIEIMIGNAMSVFVIFCRNTETNLKAYTDIC